MQFRIAALNGKKKPSAVMLCSFAKVLGVSPLYLIYGKTYEQVAIQKLQELIEKRGDWQTSEALNILIEAHNSYKGRESGD